MPFAVQHTLMKKSRVHELNKDQLIEYLRGVGADDTGSFVELRNRGRQIMACNASLAPPSMQGDDTSSDMGSVDNDDAAATQRPRPPLGRTKIERKDPP